MSGAGLKTEKVTLSDRVVIVQEATYLMGVERGALLVQIAADERIRESARPQIANIFSALLACSTAEVALDDLLNMRQSDVEKWITAVMRVNPNWLAWLQDVVEEPSAEAQAEALKKKGKRARK